MKKTRKKQSIISVLLAVLFLLPLLISTSVTEAAINRQINFQGKVTNLNGTNVTNGSYTFRFRIYNHASNDASNSCAANSCLWEETKSVQVTDGIFQTQLGSSTSLPGSIDFNTDSLYLGILFNGDNEMAPRVRFTAAPYAFNADQLDGLDSSAFSQLAPSAVQGVNSTNSAVRLNQTGSGGLLQLQADGSDVVTVAKSGNITTTGTVTATGGTLTVGAAATQGNIVINDGDGETVTFTIDDVAASTVIKVPDAVSASDTMCLVTLNNCVGQGANTALSNLSSVAINTDLSFDNTANRQLTIAASAAGTAGRQLTVSAGSAAANATAVSGGLLSLQGGAGSTGATSNGAGGGVTIAGGAAGAGTGSNGAGGNVSITGGAASTTGSGNANGGSLTLDSGAKANSGTSTVTIGGTNATTVQIGNNSLSSGTQSFTLGANNTAGGTTNVTIGSGSSAAGGSTTVQAKGGLTLTGGAASSLTTSSGALTVTSAAAATWSTAAGNLTLDSAGSTVIFGTNTTTLQKSGTAFTLDINNASNSTLTVTNAGAGTASLSVEGGVTIGASQVYTVGATAGVNSTCSGGNVLTNQVVTGGIVTGGTCAAVGAGGVTLQTAYDNDAAGTVADIITSSSTKTILFKAGTGFDAAALFDIQDDAGISVFIADTTNDRIYIGDPTADSIGTLLVLDTKNTAGDPAGINGGMYYNSNLSKFRCYEADQWKDCISTGGGMSIRSFVDGTADAVVDNATTTYWDSASENNNTFPNITLSSTSKAVYGIVTVETQSTGTADIEVTARVERSTTASVAACNSGTSVGGAPGTFASNTNARKTSTTQFVDAVATTGKVWYNVCSDLDTVGTTANITRIRVTLFEVDNSNL